MALTVEVTAQQDFWKRLASGNPNRAVAEIVTNAFDADADEVSVNVNRNPIDGIASVTFADNGEGIAFSKNEHLFSQLGNSWKLRANKSHKRGRILQGRNGEGRFRALSLGEVVTWQTTFEQDGKRYSYRIEANNETLGRFHMTDLAPSKSATGTIVTIHNLYPKASAYFEKNQSEEFVHLFAPYLNKYRDVRVSLNGQGLDVSKVVSRSSEVAIGPIKLTGGTSVTASLEILEWRSQLGRSLYLCDESGFTISERPPEVRAPGYDFGAYLKSRHFSNLQASSLADLDMEEGLAKLVRGARDFLSVYFRRREKERASGLIQKWKEENVYPFDDSESAPVVKEARKIFDMCAVTIADHARGFDEQNRVSKALSFRLLREAIQERPSEISKIMSEVLNLSQEKRKQFSSLLDKTKLTDIIDSVAQIDHRISAAIGLRSLVCSDGTRATMKERQHIHQIVQRNPWMFGEEFTLGVSESSLTNALREHLRRLKRDTRVLEPVLVAGGKNARVDLMLCQMNKRSGRTDDHHLIVELKRASKLLSYMDLGQVISYANAIMKDSRYLKTNVEWTFWLVGTEVSDDLEAVINSSDRPAGCAHVFKEGAGRIWVKTWGQLLHDCISRHNFVKDALNIAIEEDDAVEYLNQIYPEFVPQAAE